MPVHSILEERATAETVKFRAPFYFLRILPCGSEGYMYSFMLLHMKLFIMDAECEHGRRNKMKIISHFSSFILPGCLPNIE
ncbi:unnamed protein product [Allacma fusca]|uniref:Uncharacterized protein n=1 Tax=Allacma fusca TaxID=39272 RepID=A0A8J2PW75_9HEXA|nr:unnamed protein product [Allacma fusca]